MAIAVEIISAELAQDGGPAPDVRCTLAQHTGDDERFMAVSTSVCRQTWTPAWKETLHLDLIPGTSSFTRGVAFDLVLWDDSVQHETGESQCLGELVIPFEDTQPPVRGSAAVRSLRLLQGSGSDERQVGTVFIRARRSAADSSPRGVPPRGSLEPDVVAPARPSGMPSPGHETGEQPVGINTMISSPKAEIGFFDANAQNTGRSSIKLRPDGQAQHSFKALRINDGGTQVFQLNASSGERTSLEASRNSLGSPGSIDRKASVMLLRAPPHGAVVVGEQVGVGIGLKLTADGEFFVSSIVEGTPAAHAAGTDTVAVGDIVEAINGVRCQGQPVEHVIEMMKGPAYTAVQLNLRRKEMSLPRAKNGRSSMLLIRLSESFTRLKLQEESFSTVLLLDLSMASGSHPERFRYIGIGDHHDEVEVSIEVKEELPGLDQRSSREICDQIVWQSSDVFSKFRQSPSMEHFRSVKHYLKAGPRLPSVSAPLSFVAPISMSKLDAAMEAVKMNTKTGGTGDPLMRFNPDVETSIGQPASSLRIQSVAALQNTYDVEAEAGAIPGPDSVHLGHQDRIKEKLDESGSPQVTRQNKSESFGETAKGMQLDLRQVYFRFAALIVCVIAMALILGSKDTPVPWHWLAWSSILYAGISPWSQSFLQFFAGGAGSPVQWISDLIWWQNRSPSGSVPFWWLAISTFVSATLGDTLWEGAAIGYQAGGVTGAFAHSVYYVGMAVMFVIIYRLRIVHPHAQSMLQLINTCYGYEACGLFGALTLYRILSLVWTAALTTGLLFVEYDAENGLFWGALLCGVAPLFYTLMGGVYSLYSVHPLQAAILLIFSVSMFIAIPASPNWIHKRGSWTIEGGGDLIIVRLFQGSFSLPWVSAVLTDRSFLSTPGVSLAAVLVGTLLAYCFSFMSGLLGVYASFVRLNGKLEASGGIPAIPIDLGRHLGPSFYHLAGIMTIANSMGVMDACFVAVAKLGGLEAYGLLAERSQSAYVAHPLSVSSSQISKNNVLVGRITLMMVGGIGVCCLAGEATRSGGILSARLSGIMTMGIGPPMLLMCVWQRAWKRSPTAFILPLLVSITIGAVFASNTSCAQWAWGQCVSRSSSFPSSWQLGGGAYAYELGLTVYSFLLGLLACFVGFLLDLQFRLPDSPEEANTIRRHAEKMAAEDSS